jgi:hypothetical protein
MLTYGFIITILGIVRGVLIAVGSTISFLTILPAQYLQGAAITASGFLASFQGVMPQTMAAFFLCVATLPVVISAIIGWKILKLIRG